MTGDGAATADQQPRPRLIVMASTFPVHRNDGVPAFVLDIAREQAREFDVTVLTPMVPGAPRSERLDGVDVVRFRYFFSRWEDLADGAILDNLRANPTRWLQVLPLVIGQAQALRRLVRQTPPAAIHAHWVIPQGLVAALVAPRVPTIVTTHGADIYALNNPVLVRVKSWVLRRAARVSTVNADMVKRLVSWRVPASRIDLLPMGVDLDHARSANTGLMRERGRIVVVGRLVEKKGIAVLVDALRKHITHRDAAVTVVGDGPLRAQLERQARGWRVRFLGQLGRDDVLREMGHSSVFVIPSIEAASGDREGLPVVLLEAAAMGAAIVASDLPGINEALQHGTSALLVPAGDAEALGAAIDRLLSDDALRQRLGRGAQQRAELYSVTRIGASYRDAVHDVIRSEQQPVTAKALRLRQAQQ